MAQDKRVFTGGMDKDSEPRLIKQGDYRDAKNIRNIASSDGTSGSVENIEGTQEVNYNFIEESQTIVEIIDEHVVQEVHQKFYYQDLIISQREFLNRPYNFKIWYRVFLGAAQSGGLIAVNNGEFSWTGDNVGPNGSATAIYLLGQFGEGGVSSENIEVQSTGGEPLTLHTEVFRGVFNAATNSVTSTDTPFPETLASGGSDCYIIRFIADIPEVQFQLDFSSIYNTYFVSGNDNALPNYWSGTVNEVDYPLGWFSISSQTPPLVILSQNGMQELLDGQVVEEAVSEDGTPIGGDDNPFSGNGAITEVQMTIGGINPTTPQDPQNEFKIFSVVENGNGTINAIPFAQDAFNQFESDFNSGDPFEFDGDQTEIAASIHDKLSVPFSTQILVPGSTNGTTHTISTLNNNVSTSFGSNTQLGVVRSSNLSATASANDFQPLESYNSLSSFSSYQDSSVNFIESNPSVSILGDAITLQNPVRASFNRELFFPVPSGGLVKGEVYRIEANISTFSSSGNSITFQTQDGKNVSPAITSTNSSFSFQFEAQDNSEVFKLVVSNNFAEQDTIVVSGISIRQFTNAESELIVKFRAPYTFDLVFGTNAASVISDYQAGTSQRDLEWFDGVSVNLNQTIQYGSFYDNLIEDNANYESQIGELTATISSLNTQLDALTQEYNSTISSINAALALDSSVAIGSYNLINDSLSNLTSVIEANDETLFDLTTVLQNNIDDGSYADGYAAGENAGVASQAQIIAGLNSDLEQAQLELENQDAETELSNIQNALNAAAVEVTPTTLEGVQALIEAYNQASQNASDISNELGGLITLLGTASFSDSTIEDNLQTQISDLETAIQAIVDIDTTLAGDSGFNNIADLVAASTTVNNDYTNLTTYLTNFATTVQNIVSTAASEEFLSEDGYVVSDVSLATEYATYQVQLNDLGGQIQTLLNALNSLSVLNTQLNSDLEIQAQAAQDAANDAQAEFNAQLAAASAETAAAVSDQQTAQLALDEIVAALGIANSDQAATAIEEGFVDSEELQIALNNFDTTNANLVAVNPDIATAQQNLTSLINIANDLQNQLDNITPEDGVSQADVDAAIDATEAVISDLQLALEESVDIIDLLSANIITNGDFTNNSDENVSITGNHYSVTASIEDESLVFSNPDYLATGNSQPLSAQVNIELGVLTQGTYLLFYNYSGSGTPTDRLRNYTELIYEYQSGSGITRLSENYLNNNSKLITYSITPFNEGDVFRFTLLGFAFDGSVDNIKLFKVPDNLVLPTNTNTSVSNVFGTIEQLIIQQGVSIANMYTEDDIETYYQQGLADGAAGVDITTDNQAVFDEAYAQGVASVNITSDNQAVSDTAYLFGYNQGFEQGVLSVDITADNAAAVAEVQGLLSVAEGEAEFFQAIATNSMTDVFSMIGLLMNLSSSVENFTATALNDALNNLSLIGSVDQSYIDSFNEEYTQEAQSINDVITVIQQQLLTLIQNPAVSNNVNEEFSFVLYGDVSFQGGASFADEELNQGRAIQLLYWNTNIPGHQAPISTRYIELVPDSGIVLNSGILGSCHLFDGSSESHFQDQTYQTVGAHDHIRVINSGTDNVSILKLSIRNIESSSILSSVDGPVISDDFNFFDENGVAIDRGFHFTISVLAGDPNWEFLVQHDDGVGIANVTSSDGSLHHVNLLNVSYSLGLSNSGVSVTNNINDESGFEDFLPIPTNSGLSGSNSAYGFSPNSSGVSPDIHHWEFVTATGGGRTAGRWYNNEGRIIFPENILSKTPDFPLLPNKTYEVTFRCWGNFESNFETQARNLSVDLGDNSLGSSHENITSSELYVEDGPNVIYENQYRRWEAAPGNNVAVIDNYSYPPNFDNHYHKIIITTGPSYSANVIRFYGASPDPDPLGSDNQKIGGFTGWLTDVAIREISNSTVSETNVNINLLSERTATSQARYQLSSPLYNNSRILNGSARRIVKDNLTGIIKERPIVAGGYKCIGSYEDKPKNRVYYFVFNERTAKKYDCILEYDLMTDSIQTVYQDGRSSSDNSPNNILNFSEHHLITGVNKVDDILYFTDNLNRPRKINVELAKQNERNIENPKFIFKDAYYRSNLSTVYIGIGPNSHPFEQGDHIYAQIGAVSGPAATAINGYSEIIGVVRKPSAGTTFNVTQGSVTVNASLGHGLGDFAGDYIGIQDSGNNNFPVYYQISSIAQNTITLSSPYNGQSNTAALPVQFNGENAVGLITNSPWGGSFSSVDGVILYADPYSDIRLVDAYSPLISFGTREDKMRYFDVIKHQPTHKPSISIETDMSFATNNILDNVFQFKYRYIHKDDEQTSYGPISDVVVDPIFGLNAAVDAADYAAIANKIIIGYDDTIADVKDIEIVARKGNTGEFVLVDTLTNNFIKYLKKVKNEYLPEFQYTDIDSSVSFYNNGTYPFVDKKDSDKLFDVVPKLAKAQTILSNNRIAYGNVLEGYDNTKIIASSSFSFDGDSTLDSNAVSIQTSQESGVGGWTTIDGELFNPNENNFGGNGGHTKHVQKWYLGNLDLSSNKVQTIFINYSWTYTKDPVIGSEINRNGSFSLPNINVTGISNVDELGNFIASSINAGNGTTTTSGIGDIGENETVASYEPDNKLLRIRIKYLADNETSSMSTIDWETGDFNPQNESLFISGEAGLSSFKTGAFHNFGIAYFDETNRCSFVNVAPDLSYITAPGGVVLNGTRPYNKFFTESAGPPIGTSSKVSINIFNKPPKFATKYQLYYTGNTTVDNDPDSDFPGFIQMMFVGAKVATDSNDKQIYLNMGALKGKDWSYNQANNSKLNYNYVAGDRIRFISFDSGNGRQKFTEYVDLEIAGMDLYLENEEPPISVNGETEGFYLRINDPGDTAIQVESGTISIAHTGFDYTNSGYEKLIAEIYRPKKDLDEDLMVYYEIGDKIPIKNPGSAVRSHGGNSPQGQNFIFNKEIGDYISNIPATINISSGDVYFKPRIMANETDGSPQELFNPEDYYLNDFHKTNHYSKGRINIVNNNSAERRLEATVYFSETYSSTGSVNGLSSFNPANIPYFDYNKNFGSIQALKMRDNDLLIFHESKVGRVLVQKDILNTASGEGLVSLSTDVIGNYVNLYQGEYGCCLQPESIVGFGNVFYFIDIKRGAALRLSADGLTVTSDNGMRDYFRDLGELYVINDPENTQFQNPFSIVAGYDPKYDEYIVTFPNVYDERKSFWNKDYSRWSSSNDKYQNKVSEILYYSQTIAFNERTNRWTSFYDFYPDYYGRVGKQFIGFKEGRLYKHNMTDRLYQDLYDNTSQYVQAKGNTKYNNFYGKQYDSYIEFPFNAEPSSVKSFNSISLECDSKLFTSMYANIGQVIQGEGLVDAYKGGISTNIGYKAIEGDIFNYQSNQGLEPYISGVGTNFIENIKKGDVVRIFGSSKQGGAYTFVTRIVLSVISNTLLYLSENVNLILEGTHIEVLDYKTKEGVQYSMIPFVESIINVSGRDGYTGYENRGDGSEIIGIGFVESQTVSNGIAEFSGSFNNNSYSISKRITPRNMIVGAEYVLAAQDVLNPFKIKTVNYEASYQGNYLASAGDIFVCQKNTNETSSAKVISTDIKLYIRRPNNQVVLLGYPYDVATDKIIFVKDLNYSIQDESGGFLFAVKNGNVDGEKMKGQYMMTKLTTEHPGIAYLSRYKFNLYGANADVDKSELSNR